MIKLVQERIGRLFERGLSAAYACFYFFIFSLPPFNLICVNRLAVKCNQNCPFNKQLNTQLDKSLSAFSQKLKRNPSTFAVGAAVKLFLLFYCLSVRFRPFLFVKQTCVCVWLVGSM